MLRLGILNRFLSTQGEITLSFSFACLSRDILALLPTFSEDEPTGDQHAVRGWEGQFQHPLTQQQAGNTGRWRRVGSEILLCSLLPLSHWPSSFTLLSLLPLHEEEV